MRLRGLRRGALLGALLGLTWALIEHALAWAAGSVAPPAVWGTIVLLDVGVAVAVGGLVGMAAPRLDGVGLALAVVGAFSFCRVVAPPGMGAEALYLVIAVGAWRVGRWLVGEGGALMAPVHVIVLGALALLALDLLMDLRGIEPLRGVALLAAVAAAPLVALVLDRLVACLVRDRGRRLVGTLAALVVVGVTSGHPLDVTPLVDDVVTGVPPPAGTPDVILVSLDTTRADHLSLYGYERETSPHLGRLARDGVVYQAAHSPAGWTLPGHASLMTGLHPTSHGAHLSGGWLGGESVDGRPNVAHPLAARHRTLAELLRDRGYRTAAFLANFSYLYRDYGLAQGFGVYDDAPGLLLRLRPPVLRLAQLVRPAWCAKPFRTAREINAAALAWLDAAGSDRPVFLFLNYMEPHQPWVAESPHDQWARAVPGQWTLARTTLYTHAVRDIPEQTRTFITANYDGQIAAMDEALGELMAALRRRGRYENALVIVTADHGELLGEHSEMGHMGRTLYEPLLRVPLVVKGAGSTRRRGTVERRVSLVDVLPTVVAATGAELPDNVEGRPLGDGEGPVFAEEGINPFLVAKYGTHYDRALRVVYDGPLKLITTSRGERMLFDVSADPHETRNLATTRPDQVARLEQLLQTRSTRALAAVGRIDHR